MNKILVFLSIFIAASGYGQWVQTGGPSAGSSSMAFNSKGDIFDLKLDLIRSTDNGNSWQNITPNFITYQIINWGIAHDNIYFFLADGSFFRSTDNGNSWNKTFKTPSQGLYFYFSNAGGLYLYRWPVGDTSMFRSLDDGATWQNTSSKLPNDITNSGLSVTQQGKLFLMGYQRNYVYFSTDNGDTWTKQSTLPYRLQTGIQSTTNGYLYCANAIYDSATDVLNGMAIRSMDNGKTWDSLAPSLQLIIASNDIIIGSPASDSLLFSKDFGNSWSKQYFPNNDQLPYNTDYTDLRGNIYWSTDVRTLKYMTTDGSSVEFTMPIGIVNHIIINKDKLIFAGGDNFFSHSTNTGNNWTSYPTWPLYSGNDFGGFIVLPKSWTVFSTKIIGSSVFISYERLFSDETFSCV